MLGAAAGGGVPQWNCACANCDAARQGRIPRLTQSSVALSADGVHWFLINASPDLRSQFEAFPGLHPIAGKARSNPFEAVLLTNADLDHTLGLLLLREGEPLHIHAAPEVRETLADALGFQTILNAFCGVQWHPLPFAEWTGLPCRDGQPSGLLYRAIALRSAPAAFRSQADTGNEMTTAFLFKDERTGGTLLLAPDVFEIAPPLARAMETADAILFDGTFWSEDELGGVKSSARPASRMGHLPIRDGSLAALEKCPARHRVYLHINNTNPILQPDCPERHTVEKAGLVVGLDGMEFEL
ncbi:MAG: pyrroloquinoline quinone biosynthesis protein PqqB [Chthoniobacteraceae bacterium]